MEYPLITALRHLRIRFNIRGRRGADIENLILDAHMCYAYAYAVLYVG
jgi:hypothetical protein